jgi:Uma2 family endonuclease
MEMSVAISPENRSVLMENIGWSTFEALLSDLGEHGGRLAYSGGVLEIVAPTEDHEHVSRLIGRLIETLTEELGIEVKSVKSTTLKRADLEKAVEPDESYYIGRNSVRRKGKRMDLPREAPPDLGIEVDVTAKSLPRLPIHAALGVPEIWTWEKGKVTFRVLLAAAADYEIVERSRALPMLTADDVNRWLSRTEELGETKLIQEFRAWVRKQPGRPSTEGDAEKDRP